ncbi:hypothetical protein TNCT_716671 [Trichonephila clavata]|uniref:Uncharacterized protein n=1 Tax=Trichonephila clavata TaxID=2740835 RepID=A0A8X6I473_TRICU|nr:hypothetical protein TNCT_716671 [Trichonephila clavata]
MNLYRSFCRKPRDKLSESDGAGSPDHPGIYSPLCTPSRRNNPNSLSFQENPVCRKSSKPPTERREGNSRKKKENKKKQGGGRLPDFLPCLCAVCGCPGAFFCGASVEKQTSIYSFSRVYISSSRTRGGEGRWRMESLEQGTSNNPSSTLR